MEKNSSIVFKPEITSRETIKPASPTPPHLKYYKLCRMDQYTPPSAYIPLVFFYANAVGGDGPADKKPAVSRVLISQTLRESLSKTLTRFYPIAGRFKQGNHDQVDCNDEGVDYMECEVNCPISAVLGQPSLEKINHFTTTVKLQPDDETDGDVCRRPLLYVQANFFEEGGLALGVCLAHRIADAASFMTFIKGWTSTAVGLPDLVVPDFSAAASAFPPLNPPPRILQVVATGNSGAAATRLVFEASQIATLKANAASASVPHPTRVEAVTALIFKCVMSAASRQAASSAAASSSSRLSLLIGGVNMRARLVPPLPTYSFGNVLGLVKVLANNMGNGQDLPALVKLFRKSVTASSGGNQEKEDGSNGGGNFQHGGVNEIDYHQYSSWCRFPIYEADFGWGKPTWAVLTGENVMKGIYLFDNKEGDGVEVWVTMNEHEMALFERDEELLEFCKLNPSAC